MREWCRVDPQAQAWTYLELRGKVPRRDKGGDLLSEKQLQALIVVVPAPLAVVDCEQRSARGRQRAGADGRLGSALLCHSFFLRPDLRARFFIVWGPSSVTSLVSFL